MVADNAGQDPAIVGVCLIPIHQGLSPVPPDGALSNRAPTVKPFLAKPLYAIARCGATWPRRSAERSRVAGAPRGPGSGRSSRPHRGWGSGAQARSQRRSPASRPRRVRVVGSGQACAGFTVVSAVGTGPPHDGPSRDRPSKVSGAVQTAAGPSAEWPRPRPRQGRPKCPTTAGTRERVGQLMACTPDEETSMRDQGAAEAEARASKLVPVFHIACRITASLRASATAARLKPRRFFSAKPQLRSVLSACTCVRIDVAAS